MLHRRPSPSVLLAAAACVLLAGCASHSREMMGTVSPEVARDLSIASIDGAVVVFMRPAERGGGGEATVFDITAGNNNLVGIVRPDTKVAYRVAAGERLFMVVGDHADFMRADLAAGKTYHAYIESHGHLGTARLSLVPVRGTELAGEEFTDRDGQCRMRMPDEAAYLWAESIDEEIMSKRAASWPRWKARSEDSKADATLRRSDGR